MDQKTKEAPQILLAGCESSQIHAHGYDAATSTLALQFKRKRDDGTRVGGSVYHYDNVPPVLYEQFCEAESKGEFFGKHIKNMGFTYRKIEPIATDAE